MSSPERTVILAPDVQDDLVDILLPHHILSYRIHGDTVENVRILHKRADPARHLHP